MRPAVAFERRGCYASRRGNLPMGLTLATFNVKNLLEPPAETTTADVPLAAADRSVFVRSLAPSGLERADERALLPQKIAWIARQLHECDADVIGLQEIGPPELLARVLAELPGPRESYGEPIVGTPDARGIRCALVSKLPVVAARVHTAPSLPFPVYREGDPPPFGDRIPLRRGMVHARVQAPDLGAVDVLVVHFKSPLPVDLRDAAGVAIEPKTPRARAEGSLRSLVWRAAEALHARGIVDGLLSADPLALVAVVGDLNDHPGSAVLRALQGDGDGALLDCAGRVAAEARFSAIHRGRRIQIDHVLATERLYGRLTSARFLNGDLREHGVSPGGDEAQTVDSDHAPLVTRFE
jgi:endonuclease/exonuclease/phosphatase family metal-dependent hydrolase